MCGNWFNIVGPATQKALSPNLALDLRIIVIVGNQTLTAGDDDDDGEKENN